MELLTVGLALSVCGHASRSPTGFCKPKHSAQAEQDGVRVKILVTHPTPPENRRDLVLHDQQILQLEELTDQS